MISTGRDTYMTIWSLEEKDGRYKAKTTTSRKNKQTNEYQNSNWIVYFVGDAATKASSLKERDRIIIKSGDLSIENIYYPENGDKKAYTFLKVTVFNFDKMESNNTSAPKTAANDDDLPF